MSAAPGTPPGSLVTDTARGQLRLFAALLLAANVLLPIGQILYAEAIGKDYAPFFWGEWNAITWFSSVQLLLVAFVAYANHQAIGRLEAQGLGAPGTRRWIWLVFAVGFVFLSLDERFGFHEFLRDDVFRPRQWFNLPFLRDGDVSLYGYLAIGIGLAWFLLGELRQRSAALVLFGVGVAIAAASVVVDTLAKDITKEWMFSKFWTSAFEESGEIWAQMFFAFSFLVLLDWRLARLSAIAVSARDQVVRGAKSAVAVNLLLPLGVLAYALITDQPFWRFFSVEDAPTEWFSSVQCLAIAGIAWANYVVHGALRRSGVSELAEVPWVWIAFTIGFVVLGLDERFDLHEALRDQVLQPAGIGTDVPYMLPGDFGLWLFYAAGLGFTALLLRELRRWPPSFALVCASFSLGLVVIVIDSLTDIALRNVPFHTFWDYAFEETGELWAQLLCLLAFLAVLHGRLGQLAAAPAMASGGEATPADGADTA